LNEETHSKKCLWSMAGQRRSENLEDQLCRQGSSAERDGMNYIALSRSRDQTLHRQLTERVLEAGPLRSPQRLSMVVSRAFLSPGVKGMIKVIKMDLHGYHPSEIVHTDVLKKIIQQTWEMGENDVTLIHGHG
jgi:hypothetical protein